MWKVTWKGLMAHKIRFLLTAVSVMLGVAFMSGTLVLTATIQNTFDGLFVEIFEGTDAQVRGVELVESMFGPGDTPRQPVPAATLEVVRGVDGVEAAEPAVDVPYAQLIDGDGEEIGGGAGPPVFGLSWTDNEDLNPFRLERGSEAPRADDEIVIDRRTADEGDFEVGDIVDVLTLLPTQEYTIVGIAKFGTQDSALGASIVQFTVEQAQRINGMPPDQYSEIGVVADSGVSQDDIKERIQAAIADPRLEVLTGQQLIEENQDDVDQFLGIFNQILLAFAGVSLVVALFIIYNTFSIIVAQRTREMALLRAIGASVGQVRTSILLESIAIGVIAGAIGFGLGVMLAVGIKTLLDAIGLDIPASGLTIPPAAIISSFVVAVVVTVLSALIPARRVPRVPPIAAMRDVAVEQRKGFAVRAIAGVVIVVTGLGLMLFSAIELPDNALAWLGVGAVALLVGVIVVGPVIARPLVRVIGAPLPKIKKMTGTLARENAMRNPRRTSATAAALMIGVALVGFITIFAASAKESIAVTLDRELQTDFIVSGFSGGFAAAPLSPALAEEMRALPELSAVSGVRYAGATVDGDDQFMTALDTRVADQLLNLGVSEGNLADVGTDGVAISKEYAESNDLALGDPVNFVFPTGGVQLFVRAIYEGSEIGMTGHFVMSIEAFDLYYLPEQRSDFIVLARLADGVTPAEGVAAIEPLLEAYPTAELQNNAEFRETQEGAINMVVNLVYGLLALAVFIALIGIANTLALSIHERRRELGLLRAVGTTKAQVRSMVRWESVMIAVLGTVLGLAIGLFFGWAIVRAVRDDGFTEFAAAPGQLLIVVVVAAVAGVGAAIFPARRASKLDVLEAIATE